MSSTSTRAAFTSSALVLAALCPTAASTEPRFPAAVSATEQYFGGPIRIADFDGDGRLDLASLDGSLLYVRSGDGFGGFGAPTAHVSPGFATLSSSWTSADLDADGDPDIVGVKGNIVWHRLNDGAGGFAPPQAFPTGVAWTSTIDTGDFDGDGALDLVTTGSGDAVVLLGDGLGTFAALPPVSTSPLTFADAAVADLDGDGDLDVVLSGRLAPTGPGLLLLEWNDGTGVLSPGPTFLSSLDTGPRVVAGDVDGDLDVDLVVGDQGETELWRNLGGATFAAPKLLGVASRTEPALVDLDGSGLPEILVCDGWTVYAFRDGGVLDGPPIERPTGGYGASIASGLVDGDTSVDVVIGATLGPIGRLTFLRGDPAALLEGEERQEVGDPLRLVGLSDLDGDSDLDAVAVAPLLGEVRAYANDGAGGFSLLSTLALGHAIDLAEATDLDGDGRLDLALTHEGEDRLDIVRGLPGGQFAADPPLSLPMSPQSLRFGNWNGDSRLDVVLLGDLPANVALGVFALSAGPSYSISAPISIPTQKTDAFAVIDADHDGLDDLAFLQKSPHQVIVYRNVILTLFTAHQTIPLDLPADRIVPIDADGNAAMDLAVSGAGNLVATRILLGSGSGTFSPKPAVGDDGVGDGQIDAIDVDGDGREDLVLLSTFGHSFATWLRSVGNGTLEAPRSLAVPGGPTGLEFGDVTGDGRPDFVTSYHWDSPPAGDSGGLYVAPAVCSGTVGRYGVGCPLPSGAIPSLALDGCAEVSATVTLKVGGAVGATTAWVAFGLVPGRQAIGGACDLLVQPLFPSLLPLPIAPDGSAAFAAIVPPAATASSFTLQALLATPALAATNGVEVGAR